MPGEVSTSPHFEGGGPHDVSIGRLIERTNAMQEQAIRMERTLNATNDILTKLDRTMIKFQGVLEQVSADHTEYKADVESRLTGLEEYKSDMKFIAGVRAKFITVVGWCIVALVVLALIAFGMHFVLQEAGVSHGFV